jgi:hypothetical protein
MSTPPRPPGQGRCGFGRVLADSDPAPGPWIGLLTDQPSRQSFRQGARRRQSPWCIARRTFGHLAQPGRSRRRPTLSASPVTSLGPAGLSPRSNRIWQARSRRLLAMSSGGSPSPQIRSPTRRWWARRCGEGSRRRARLTLRRSGHCARQPRPPLSGQCPSPRPDRLVRRAGRRAAARRPRGVHRS